MVDRPLSSGLEDSIVTAIINTVTGTIHVLSSKHN